MAMLSSGWAALVIATAIPGTARRIIELYLNSSRILHLQQWTSAAGSFQSESLDLSGVILRPGDAVSAKYQSNNAGGLTHLSSTVTGTTFDA
jgi:hypothetical protein